MMPRTRLASGLLLVPPALILFLDVFGAVQNRWAGYLLRGLPLALFLIVVGVGLWRGRRWAAPIALVASAGFTLVFVLYQIAGVQAWGRESWSVVHPAAYLFEFLPAAACAAAFALLAGDASVGDARGRVLAIALTALGVELGLMALIAVFGVGGMYMFDGRPWYQAVLGFTQVPGEYLLGQMGMCCGYENETIISDWIDPHWGGITRHGIPTLAAANALALMPPIYLLLRGYRRRPATAIADIG